MAWHPTKNDNTLILAVCSMHAGCRIEFGRGPTTDQWALLAVGATALPVELAVSYDSEVDGPDLFFPSRLFMSVETFSTVTFKYIVSMSTKWHVSARTIEVARRGNESWKPESEAAPLHPKL